MTATNQGRIAPTFPATSATHDDDQQAAPLDLPAVPAWAIVHRACIQIWINRLPKAMRHIDPDECNACWRVCDVLADHADVHSALNEMHDAAALLAGAIGLLPAEFMDAHIALGKMAHLLDAAADVIDRASLRLFTEGGVA